VDILLVNPPVVKPSEPPAGLALLCGALKEHGRKFMALDANIEGLMHFLSGEVRAGDTWTRRALSHLDENLSSLKNGRAFRSIDGYTKAVTEINRVLSQRLEPSGWNVSLSNLSSSLWSPVKSEDLIRAAEYPEQDAFFPYFSARLKEIFERDAPGLVGLSLNYLSQALPCFAMIGYLKKLDPAVKIILGGGLVTSWIRGIGLIDLFSGLVDEMVAGPGEERLVNLTGSTYTGAPSAPDFSGFVLLPYLSPGRIFPFSTSQGCYWARCSFCPENAEGNRFSSKPPSEALEHMHRIMEEEKGSLAHICDNALTPSFLREMSLSDSPYPWYGFARITHHLADPEFCAGLRRSGCVMLKLGLESGDQHVLDGLGKGITLEETVSVLKAVKSAGIAVYAYLLFGTPSEDRAAAERTLDFIAANNAFLDFLNLSIFNLPRASRDAAALETYDFSEGDLSLYQGFIHPRGWDRKSVRQFLDKELKRNPSVARIVRNDPPSFTSNHAPFFAMQQAPLQRP